MFGIPGMGNPSQGLLSGLKGMGGSIGGGGFLGGLGRMFGGPEEMGPSMPGQAGQMQPQQGQNANNMDRDEMMRRMMFAQLGAGIAGGKPALGLGAMLPYMMMRR